LFFVETWLIDIKILKKGSFNMKRYSIYCLVIVLALFLFLLSGCVIRTSLISVNFTSSDQLTGTQQLYIRYSDGTVSTGPSNQTLRSNFSIQTDSNKTIIGGYVSDGIVSWVPNYSYGLNSISLSGILAQKPTFPVDHVVQVGQPVKDSRSGFVDVTFAVYGTDGQLVNGQTEVFAHSSDSNLTFYNTDPNDSSNPRIDNVKEGFSWYTVNGLVTFVIQSNNISSEPLSLYSGSKLIYDYHPSNVASLSSFNLSGITLDQTISGNVYAYTATVPNDVSGTTVTYSTDESHATVALQLNGTPVNNPINLSIGSNVISIIVTAQDGNTKQTYTVNITTINTVNFNSNGGSSVSSQTVNYNGIATKPSDPTKTGYTFGGWYSDSSLTTAFDFNSPITADTALFAQWISGNALLSDLSLDQGTLKPAFLTSQTNYSVDVANSVYGIQISLMKGDPTQTLSVTGATYSSVTGNVYFYKVSNWVVGPNLIQITVTAQNQAHNRYDLTVNRVSNNTDLSEITLSTGTLTPSGTNSYSANVANNVSSITVTANLYDSNATMTVNGVTVASGHAGSAINLNEGRNVITIVVTAQDGSTKIYTVTVTRDSSGGSNAPSTTSSDAVISTDGTLTLPVGKSGEVSLGDAVKIAIPADASGKDLKLTIDKVSDTQNLLTSKDVLASPVFEILKNFSENFSKEITLTFAFDLKSLKDKQKPSVFFYDETKKAWVEVGGEVNGNNITVKVNHFTKYAVFSVGQRTDSTADTKQTISFSDISGHWAEANIKQAVSAGIVSGYPDGSFKPDRTVTRAEFAVMLMNALGPQGDGAALTFTDKAKIGDWAQKSVAQAVYAGIISGYEEGSFRPDAEITRPEMAMMIAKAVGQSSGAAAATGFADDKVIPDWAKGAVAAMKKLGIIEGKSANQFAPGDKTKRAEAVTVLLKMQSQKSK
jgi:uncharacterized repeat protein (TIGR02543 family)